MQKETGVGFLMGTAPAPGQELNDSDGRDAQEPCVQQHRQAPGFTPFPQTQIAEMEARSIPK